jgi:spore coat polysaccharide biosynthesis protein SpsF
MKTAAIIAARMNSKRFPGKVMADLCGKPVLQHVIERCRRSGVDDVIVATLDDCHEISDLCTKQGCTKHIVRRSEQWNVLGRIRSAAQTNSVGVVVRVNGDSPLVQAEWIDKLLVNQGHEYTHYVLPDGRPAVMTHIGLPEMVTTQCLEMMQDYIGDVSEHVTWHCHQQWKPSVLALPYTGPVEHNTIDTQEDLLRVKALCSCKSAIG